MCMNRCNRSLRSCTNYRRRTRGDYRLRELPFMQHFPSSVERAFAPELSPGSPGGIARSFLHISEAVLQTLDRLLANRLSLRIGLHSSGPTNEAPTFLRTRRALPSFSRGLPSLFPLLPHGAFEPGPLLLPLCASRAADSRCT